MTSAFDNDAFWRSSDCHIALNPHRVGEADGLAEFAGSNDATRSLLFFQTSGSAGFPKWCGLTREAMLASARAVNSHLKVSSKDRWLIALPLHHVGGFSILARCFASGASFVRMMEKWDAPKFADLCAEEKTTLTSLVPTQVFDLVQAKIQAPGSLRAVVVGGAGLSREIGQEARMLGWPLLQSYGMTEAASQVATSSLQQLQYEFEPADLEALPIWDLEIDADDLLTLRGGALACGYAIAQSDGWCWREIDSLSGLRTQDCVKLSDEGPRRILSFLARASSMVKVMGELVNLEAMQTRLESLADCPRDVAICALPDARRGSKIVLAGKLASSELEKVRRRFNAAAIGVEKIVESVTLAALPRSALGKLDRTAIARMLPA